MPDEWHSNCDALEERADQGLCSYGTKSCKNKGKETRTIEGIPITRDCWQETYTYQCHHDAEDNCGPLRARGCVQIKSECKKRIGKACVIYSQTYQCKGDSRTLTQIKGGKTPFCLDGNCRDQSFDANDELLSALAQLSLLKEMQGTFEGLLFKGEEGRCSKCMLSFKDCCGAGKGWGISLHLSGCSGEEKALSLKREKGLCHFVGTYCSKREPLTKICLQKKSSYCCFGSKLLRVFHEQGRAQLGIGWGNPEEPLCRGFTIEEIQGIDFSKLDLREVYEDLVSGDLMKTYKSSKLESVTQRIKERLEIMAKTRESKALESKTQGSQPQERKARGEIK